MARKVLITLQDGATFDLTETPAPNEHHLQEVMKNNPALLPLDDLGISGPLLIAGRETSLASGSIDLVGVVPSGDLVLVEFKTGPQNPDFRHALAQLIDYGSDLWGTTFADFDTGVVQRYLDGKYCASVFKSAHSLRDMAEIAWDASQFDWDSFVDRLGAALAAGDFHYVVAAQRFTPQMTRSLDYLNSVARVGKYHLIQMVQLSGNGLTGYVAQSVAAPAKARTSAPSIGATEESFLDAIDDDAYREALSGIFTTCRTLGLTLWWGAKGASIRIATLDRSEPLSIGWIFPEGSQWSGLSYLSLGYDEQSAKNTPSVAVALEDYVTEVNSISGGVAAKSKSLRVRTFKPSTVIAAKDLIIGALEVLVQTASGNED